MAQVPSCWVAGEQRLLQAWLCHAGTALELHGGELAFAWNKESDAARSWRRLDRMEAGVAVVEPCLAPSVPGEHVLQVHLRLQVRGHLDVELRSEALRVSVRERQSPGNVQVDLRGAGVMGDNIALGQRGDFVANQIYIDSSAGAATEEWLAADVEAARPRELRLHVTQERCLNWVNRHGVALCGLPAGEFTMGAAQMDAPQAAAQENPRRVMLSRACWMGAHLVTNRQYRDVRGLPPPERAAEFAHHLGDEMPVTCVTWEEARAFAEELTLLERQCGTLLPGYAYRLPTEAEWEYACRAGLPGPRHGEREPCAPPASFGIVGRREPNHWGLHDMLGLVFQWCEDAYGPCADMATTDPWRVQAPEGETLRRVVRGGCYMSPPAEIRASARHATMPGRRSNQVGFRVVLAPLLDGGGND